MRLIPLSAGCALLAALLLAGPAGANGTILQGGSTIVSGTANNKGTVTIDPCAGPKAPPTLPPITIGTLGSISGAIPALPNFGNGESAFVATTDLFLNGGTYDFTTYFVQPGVTVTYLSAVTIRTTGNVDIAGRVVSAVLQPGIGPVDASITFRCGGDFIVAASNAGSAEGVLTFESAASITIDVAGSYTTQQTDGGARSQVLADSGSVTILSHAGSGGIQMRDTDLRGEAGTSVRAAGRVQVDGSTVFSGSNVTVQAYGDMVGIESTDLRSTGNARVVLIEGEEGVYLGFSTVACNGEIRINSFGQPVSKGPVGDVLIVGSNVFDFVTFDQLKKSEPRGAAPTTGDITILSASGIKMRNSANVRHNGTGDIVMTAFGADVRVEDRDNGLGSSVSHEGVGSGDVRITANIDLEINGSSIVQALGGNLDLHAVNADVEVLGTCRLESSSTLDIRAKDGVRMAPSGPLPESTSGAGVPSPQLIAGNFGVSAGSEGMDLEVTQARATTAAGTLLTSGGLRARGPIRSAGPLTVQAIAGGIDVASAVLATDDVFDGSAAVLVESYSDTGTIDATNARIASGDAASTPARSGDVTVAVYSSGEVNSYFLPKSLVVKVNTKNAALSNLRSAGFFDTGSGTASLAGPATLTVGELTTNVTLVADAKGRLRHKDGAIDFQIIPSKTGSSKGFFRLLRTGDLSALLAAAANGPVVVRFTNAVIDSTASVKLTGNFYRIGKKRGALVAPNLYIAQTKATIPGGGKDTLKMKVGLATNGLTPQAAPDVTVRFGNTTFVVTSDKFGPAVKDVFTAKNPLPGVSAVILNYARESLTFRGAKLDLGAFPAGNSVQVSIGLAVGTDSRAAVVRLRRKGKALSY